MYDVIPIITPHATACGPTCLAMLLGYYGIDVPPDDLIRECGVTVAGCTAKDLLRVGRAHGLDMKTYKETAEDAMSMDRPAILWWRYTHFVVFCGLSEKDEPVICNPSSGRFPISREAFARCFSGIALTNGDTGDFVPAAEQDVEAGQVFSLGTVTYRAMRPIARGEKLIAGNSVEIVNLIDLLNLQKRETEE